MLTHRQQIWIAFTAIYFVWGSTYLAIRFTIETLPLFMTAGLRFLLAGTILFMYARWREQGAMPSLKHWRSAFVVGGFLLLGGNGSVVWAEQYVPSGLAALIIATTPFWMVLLQWLWQKGKKPSVGVLAGIVVGFIGVGILVVPDLVSVTVKVHPSGAVALLAAALSWSIGSVYARQAHLPKSPFLSTGMEMMAGGVLLLLWGFMLGEPGSLDPSGFSSKSIAAFFYLVLVGSLVGFTAYIWLLKNVGVTRTSTYAFVNPIVAVVLGCMWAGEHFDMHIGLAAVLIIAAVIIITLNHREPNS